MGMKSIEIYGVREGANKVGADKLLADEAGLGLSSGKALVDNALEGGTSSFEIEGEKLARSIIAKLDQYGFDARFQALTSACGR